MSVDHTEAFRAFFSQWADKRIIRLGDQTDPSDWRYFINERTQEITDLARANAFRAALEEHARPYGSVHGLVEYLFERKNVKDDF